MKKLLPENTNSFLLDERLNERYETEDRWTKIIGWGFSNCNNYIHSWLIWVDSAAD
jgi:hypothetical protein